MAKKSDPRNFLEKVTTIHGTNQFKLKSGYGRALWWFAMATNVSITIVFITIIQNKLRSDQIYTKVDSTCQVNQVPFPAVSICNLNLVSFRETANIARLLKNHNRTTKEINKFFEDLPKLKDYVTPDADNATEIMNILKGYYYTMDIIMEEVHQKCENLVIYCTFNRRVKNCLDLFNTIKTLEGHCCAFNYAALSDITEMTSGLTVVFDVEPDDYPNWTSALNYGASILVSDPNDFPETSVQHQFVTIGTAVEIKVAPLVYQSEPDVRRVAPSHRECWFHDEVELEHTERYSYETCQSECSMKNFVTFCGCVPYKYPRDYSRKFCELADLPCMYNLTVYGRSVPCSPACYAECRDKGYAIQRNIVPFFISDYPLEVTRGRKVNNLAAVKVYFGKSTCNCYKLTLLMDVNYFIATYGGVLGLSFGASLLTIVELIYLVVSTISEKISRYFKCQAIRQSKP